MLPEFLLPLEKKIRIQLAFFFGGGSDGCSLNTAFIEFQIHKVGTLTTFQFNNTKQTDCQSVAIFRTYYLFPVIQPVKAGEMVKLA